MANIKMLGVDYGEARTGLAYSDALGLYAVGMGNVKGYNLEKAAEEIVRKAREIGAELIGIGKPLNMNGTSGDKVAKGAVVAVLEAMKMENEIFAPEDGTIASVEVAQGTSVTADQVIITMN